MAITVKDIAWLAGLLEGEGHFGNRNRSSPMIRLAMTDRDVVERAAALMGVKPHAPYKPRGKETYKQVYGMSVCGSRAIGWMQTILVFMGERRRTRIIEIVKAWAAAPGDARPNRGDKWAATCHPDRPRHARGLCKRCYHAQHMRKWREKRA